MIHLDKDKGKSKVVADDKEESWNESLPNLFNLGMTSLCAEKGYYTYLLSSGLFSLAFLALLETLKYL